MTHAKWILSALLISCAPVAECTAATSGPGRFAGRGGPRAREQKKEQSGTVKVWTNDDIPKNAEGISVVGQASSVENSGNSTALSMVRPTWRPTQRVSKRTQGRIRRKLIRIWPPLRSASNATVRSGYSVAQIY